MMLYLINESSILASQIVKYVKLKDVSIVSTNGFIFDYHKREHDKSIAISLKTSLNFKFKNLVNKIKDDDIVVVATDKDPAGELIACEILHFFPNAYRYAGRVDDLLYLDEITISTIMTRSSQNTFKYNLAKSYLLDKLKPTGLSELYKRQKITDYIRSSDDNLLMIPKKYQQIIEKM